jgi:hypothetical protein
VGLSEEDARHRLASCCSATQGTEDTAKGFGFQGTRQENQAGGLEEIFKRSEDI